MDDSNDGWGERSCMYRWPCGSIWYSWGVKKVWGSLDKVCFSRDGEEGGHVLLLSAVASFLSDSEKLGIADAVFICGVGPIRGEVAFSCDVGGARHLAGWLSHVLQVGMIFAVDVVTETGVLESVLTFRGMYVGAG